MAVEIPHGKGQFFGGLSGPLKSVGSLCCSVWSKRDHSVVNSAYQRIISNDSYAHDEQGDNPGQEKEESTVSSVTCYRYRHLHLAVSSLPAAPACVEVNRLGWPLAGITHSASQG